VTKSGGTESRMLPKAEDPWLSVSVIAEHAFCPLAAVLLYEKRTDDYEEDIPRAWSGRYRRKYYTLRQIEKERERRRKLVARTMWFPPVCLFFLVWYWYFIVTVLQPAQQAVASVPDPFVPLSEEPYVSYWSFINAGYEPRWLEVPLRDEKWWLQGNPWAVLVKGDVRIPVIRKRLPKNGDFRLYYKDRVRIAAYCHLLRSSDRVVSPYGFVMFRELMAGFVVPAGPQNNKKFHDQLVAARATIRNRTRVPAPPADYLNRCLNCPNSWRDRETGISECGDRFGWDPPNSRDYRYRR